MDLLKKKKKGLFLMFWAHYCSNLSAGPQLWHNTLIHNEGTACSGEVLLQKKVHKYIRKKGGKQRSLFFWQSFVL